MMHFKFLIITIVRLCFCLTIDTEHTTSMSSEFLKLQKFPTKLTLLLCWKDGDVIQLLKDLHNYDIDTQAFNVNLSAALNEYSSDYRMFLLDLTCNDSQTILLKANSTGLFRNPYRWMLVTDGVNKVPPMMNAFTDSKVYVATVTDGGYKLESFYRHGSTSLSYTRNDVGTWSKSLGFQNVTSIETRNRLNLMGETIKISIVVTNPDTLNHLWDYRNQHIDSITKVNYILTHYLMDIVNASKEFLMTSTWGYQNKTTQLYSGLMGHLQTGLADFGGTPAFFTEDRIYIIDYIACTTRTHMKFIFRAPPLSYVTNVYTQPFNDFVWYACLVMVCVSPFVVYVVAVWEWGNPEFTGDSQSSLRANVLDVIMLEISAISQQGTPNEPRSVAGRIAVIFTFLTLMFLYTSYSANIVALLQSTTDHMRTLEDLLSYRIKLGVEDIVYAHYYFSNSEDPIKKAIINEKVAPKGQPANFFNVETGIQRMRDEFFAFHVELSTGYKVVSDIFQEHEKCGLKEIEYVSLIEPWLATRKHSNFKEVLKIGMRKIHESGIQAREFDLIYTKKPKCHSKGSNFVSVGIIDCYFPFLLYSGGILISILLLLMEKFVHRYKEDLLSCRKPHKVPT